MKECKICLEDEAEYLVQCPGCRQTVCIGCCNDEGLCAECDEQVAPPPAGEEG